MAGGDFDAGKAGTLEAPAAGGPLLDQLSDARGCQRVGHRPAEIVRQRGGTDGAVVSPGGVAAAPGILHLAEQPAVPALHRSHQPFQIVERAVVEAPQPLGTAIGKGHGHGFSDDEARSPLGPTGEVVHQPVRRPAILDKARDDGSVGDAVAHRDATKQRRAKQRRVVHGQTTRPVASISSRT